MLLTPDIRLLAAYRLLDFALILLYERCVVFLLLFLLLVLHMLSLIQLDYDKKLAVILYLCMYIFWKESEKFCAYHANNCNKWILVKWWTLRFNTIDCGRILNKVLDVIKKRKILRGKSTFFKVNVLNCIYSVIIMYSVNVRIPFRIRGSKDIFKRTVNWVYNTCTCTLMFIEFVNKKTHWNSFSGRNLYLFWVKQQKTD